jgi:hypothetical protein
MTLGGPRGRLVAALVLLLFAAPSLLLGGTVLFDIPLSGEFVLAALGVPLAVITLGLAYVGRQVASKADEPALVGDRLAEKVDMSSEEYRELTEE